MSAHTWRELAEAAAGKPISDEEADVLLWAGSAFPFASPRVVYAQVRHTARHRVCCDDPGATCGNNRKVRKAHQRRGP